MSNRGAILLLVSLIVLLASVVYPTSQANAQSPPPTSPQAEVITDALNMREGPGTNYAVVGVAWQGDTFEIIGANADKSWLQVKHPDGRTVWISGWPDYTRVQGSLEGIPVAPGAAVSAPATLPAAGKLAFMTTSGGDIYLINADGSGLRHLVSGGLDPAFSPSGQQIAFARWEPTSGIYVIGVEDGAVERLIRDVRQPKSPAWSPDGAQLIFNMQRGGWLEPIKECRNSSSDDPDWIPYDAYDVQRSTVEEDENGDPKTYEYCYWRPPKPYWQISQLDLANGQYTEFDTDTASFGPTWDPRNSWRALYSGDVNVVQLDLNTRNKNTFIEGREDHNLAFAPDGVHLAMAHKNENNQWTIDVFNLDTGERNRLTSTGNSVAPAWSPDSRQIAFLTDREGHWNIWVMNADGANQRPMFAPGILDNINFSWNEVDERMITWGP